MTTLVVLVILALNVWFWFYTRVVLPSRCPPSKPIPYEENKPIARLMDENNLPKPSSLMAGMLALRIARIPADRKYAKTRELSLRIPIRDGEAHLEVRLESRREVTGAPMGYRPVTHTVTIGLPGDDGGKGYLSVSLNDQEQAEVAEQMLALMKRSREMVDVEEEGKSQMAALTILENLL